MTIKQSRYITADTTGKKEMAIRTTELDKVKDDPFVRKSEVQQTVNNSTLPVSSRAVNLAINSMDIPSLDGYATEGYVDEELESVNSRVDLIDEKATEAKASADTAKQAVGDTVGTGKLMREGAYGVGQSLTSFTRNDFGSDANEYTTNGSYGLGGGAVTVENNFPITTGDGALLVFGDFHNKVQIFNGARGRIFWRMNNSNNTTSWESWAELFHDANTRTDKNNVLHSGTGTPINTLNVSDMAQDVVDRDDMTVTSGAVFRAIKQLTDQITSLKARVRELEDGGA